MRNEIVLITGGSSGIGLAAAHRFAALGARVIMAARNPDRLAAAVRAVGHGASAVAADLSSPDGVIDLAVGVGAVEGRVDVLINCAGQMEIGPAERVGPEGAERLIRINYLGPIRTIDACLPLLRRSRRRSIINVSSLAGSIAPPFMAAYAASKSALDGYTRALRQELAPEGFHVGLISPGPVESPMTEGLLRTRYYPIPPGVGVLSADQVALSILRAVQRRAAEVFLPRHVSAAVRLGRAVPSLVDRMYFLLRRRESADVPAGGTVSSGAASEGEALAAPARVTGSNDPPS